ncbi:ABC transporter permease [Microbacterium sp. A588]
MSPELTAAATAAPVLRGRRYGSPLLLAILKRIGRAILVILGVTVSVVVLLDMLPGSVVDVILGDGATPESVAVLEEQLGLNLPIWDRYGHWLVAAVQGDLGSSMLTHQPVLDAIVSRLPVTLELAVLALLIALLLAVPMAIVSASRQGGLIDRVMNATAMGALSIPAFVSAPILLYFLAMQLGWFPVTGWEPLSAGLGANLQTALLPAFAIALPEMAVFYRMLRSDLATTLQEDYIGAARAKGMPAAYVMVRHALRPSSFSLITVIGVNLGRLLGGTVIVETLFALPGLGSLVISAINSRDVVTVQGIVVFVAVAYVLINTLVDLSYGFLDPRVRKAARA